MSQKVNIGIAGTGFIHDLFHMPAYAEMKQANVVAVAGTTQEKTSAFAKKWGIDKSYFGSDGFAKMCRDPDVHVVDLGVPNNFHLPYIVTAAENHKHVICEKPLGRNSTEAKKAVEVVERYGVLNCYAENQVFMPQVARAVQFIDSGVIGKITWIRAREAHSGPHSKWFWDSELSGGGVLLDMGCHTIEVVRHFLKKSKPVEVGAWTATLVHKIKAEDNSLVLMKFDGGVLGKCENSWSAKGGLDLRIEVYGSEGAVFIDVTRETGIRLFTSSPEDRSSYVVEKADASNGWMFPTWREHETFGYINELQHFVQCVAKGETPSETFKDGLLVNRIMDVAYEASKMNRWLPISEGLR
jgi:predicted dehydrogenase